MDVKSKQWSVEETNCLLALWSSTEIQHKLQASRTRPVFEQLQREMAAAGFHRSVVQITNKLKKLKKDYRDQKKDPLGRGGNGRPRRNPRFDHVLDSVLGNGPARRLTGGATAMLEAMVDETLSQKPTDAELSAITDVDTDAELLPPLDRSSPAPPSSPGAQRSSSSSHRAKRGTPTVVQTTYVGRHSDNRMAFSDPNAITTPNFDDVLQIAGPMPTIEANKTNISTPTKKEGSFDLGAKLDLTWAEKIVKPLREVQWTDDHKQELMSKICSYKTGCGALAHVLLLGPVGSGKSSFISSVQSVFSGRVLNHAMVGSNTTSFTKKLQNFTIQGKKGEGPTALTMCDVMGLGEGEGTGISFHDILAVIKGHSPEGHKFSSSHPLHSDTAGYLEDPGLADRVHCVVFVLDASRLTSYCRGLRGTFQQLREHISDLGVHQVAVLTHIDIAMTDVDVKSVYKSLIIQQLMSTAGEMLGMSTSSIMPVKNYSSELDLDSHTDILLLSAVDLILAYADLYIQDQAVEDVIKKNKQSSTS